MEIIMYTVQVYSVLRRNLSSFISFPFSPYTLKINQFLQLLLFKFLSHILVVYDFAALHPRFQLGVVRYMNTLIQSVVNRSIITETVKNARPIEEMGRDEEVAGREDDPFTCIGMMTIWWLFMAAWRRTWRTL